MSRRQQIFRAHGVGGWSALCLAGLLLAAPVKAETLPVIEQKGCNNSRYVPKSIPAGKMLTCSFRIKADASLKPVVYLEVRFAGQTSSKRTRLELAKIQGTGKVIIPVSFSVDPMAKEVRLVFKDNHRTRTLHTFYRR